MAAEGTVGAVTEEDHSVVFEAAVLADSAVGAAADSEEAALQAGGRYICQTTIKLNRRNF